MNRPRTSPRCTGKQTLCAVMNQIDEFWGHNTQIKEDS